MDRSATYDFPLVIHITMGIFCTISEINSDFGRKSQFFPTPEYLTPAAEGNFFTGGSVRQNYLVMVGRLILDDICIRLDTIP